MAPPVYRDYGPASQPGSEVIDIVFVIDGSGSITGGEYGGFKLQKEGIKNCFKVGGAYAFIPYDGTYAIAVIQFSSAGQARQEIPLTVIDSEATAQGLAQDIDLIQQIEGGTVLSDGLRAAIDVFRYQAYGPERLLVVSTDAGVVDPEESLQLGWDIRTGTGEAEGLIPARICTVLVNLPCSQPPQDAVEFLRKLANTLDAPPPQPYLDQPIGHFSCAEDLIPPPEGDGALQDFVILCDECSCAVLHAGEPDCDGNGVPDECEPDCQPNGTADPCDILWGTSTDCNGNSVPDECEAWQDCQPNGTRDICDIALGISEDCNSNWIPDECEIPESSGGLCTEDCDPDCNGNGVPDECDIDGGTSPDCNENQIPDECEGTRYVDANPTVPGPRDGTRWDRAYATLWAALDEAAQPNSGIPAIFVADGTYTPKTEGLANPRDATFGLLNGVKILGGYAGYGAPDPYERMPGIYQTILSGDLYGDDQTVGNAENSYHVVTANSVYETAILDGCVIAAGNANGSSPTNCGAGLYNVSATPIVSNCWFRGNSASSSGGAIYTQQSVSGWAPVFVNCAFSGNAANLLGGALCVWFSGLDLVNCTIVGNRVGTQGVGGGIYVYLSSSIDAHNCMLWGNTARADQTVRDAQIKLEQELTTTVEYTCVQGEPVYPGQGNTNADPLMIDPDGSDNLFGTADDNLRLGQGSPSIDSGNNNALTYDRGDMDRDCDMWEPTPLDLDGQPRLMDGNRDTIVTVDRGAYEREPDLDPPDLTAAVSRKVHVGVGSFDATLPIGSAESAGVECRRSPPPSTQGLTQVILTFSEPIRATDGAMTPDQEVTTQLDGVPTPGLITSLSLAGNQLTVNLLNVPDVKCVRLILAGIEDLAGNALEGDNDVHIVALYGDVTGDYVVNIVDLSAVKAKLFQLVTAETFRCDVNTDGVINIEDLTAVKLNLFHTRSCEGWGGDGGARMGLGGELLAGAGRQADALGYFVAHESGQAAAVLSPKGGTMLVDLVIAAGEPIVGFEGTLSVDAGDVVWVRSADWTERDNVLLSFGIGDRKLSSFYDFTLLEWYLVDPLGRVEPDAGAQWLLEPDKAEVFAFAHDLRAVDGAIGAAAGDKSVLDSPVPDNSLPGPRIGGVLREPLQGGAVPVGTLLLDVAGVPGVYSLTFVDGLVLDAFGAGAAMPAGPSFTITVPVK